MKNAGKGFIIVSLADTMVSKIWTIASLLHEVRGRTFRWVTVRRLCKTLGVLLGLNLVMAIAVNAAETRTYLDELRFAELQLSAVTTDMYLYLGWGVEEKDAMKAAAGEAIGDLNELKDRLMRQDFPNDLDPLKDLTVKMCEQLTTIYRDIEKKEMGSIKEEFAPFNALHADYARRFKDIWNAQDADEIGQELNPIEEEVRWIGNDAVSKQYQKATGDLNMKNYTAAYKSFNEMVAHSEGTAASDLVKLRLSDALLMMDYEAAGMEGLDAAEKGLKLMAEIIESGRYSPVLYEAFYKWRTTEQQLHHGMSNLSAIPNKEYNEKRWHVIQTINKYVQKNPTDQWAQTQIELLWDLPNVQRGGPYGNSNLIHWGVLYGNLRQKGQA